MIKLLCFFMGLNCLTAGWLWTGVLLLYICFIEDFEDDQNKRK